MRVAWVVSLWAMAAGAAPEYVRLSWCGGDAGTTMCVTWNDAAGAAASVEYGVGGLDQTTGAESFTAPGALGAIWPVAGGSRASLGVPWVGPMDRRHDACARCAVKI